MSASPVDHVLAAGSVNESGGPLYFPASAPRLFAWLHAPAAGRAASDTGVVICKPFGYEALSSHRTLRVFAEAAANLGIPALRFDYLGSADSADIDPQADQISAWVEDVIAAAEELRRRTGVKRVCLLGVRLGALLATLAAARCDFVDELILIAPVVSGRRYLREMRTTRLAALLAPEEPQTDSPGSSDSVTSADGSMEVSGHWVSGATLAALADVDPIAVTGLGVSRALIIDRQELSTAQPLAEAFVRQGAQTEYVALPGFVESMLTATQYAVLPQAMIATITQWLSVHAAAGLPAVRDARPAHPPADPAAAPATVLRLPGESAAPETMLTERPVSFGTEARLFGIVTEPRRDELRRRAVLLLNASADQHMGVSRMHVSFARRWARRGYLVLRMDMAGIGDSDTRPGRPDDEVFPPAALADIGSAIEFVQARYGIRDVTLAGLCSGAYHALRAGIAGLPVNRLLLVNPENFFWEEGASVRDLQLAEVVRNPGLYRERAFSLGAWKRLFTGQVNIWRIVKIYLHRPLLTVESKARDLARLLHIHLPRDLGHELEALGARQVRLVFVFARGEAGIDLLKIQAGSSIRRLGERCHLHIIGGGDHTFSRSVSRTILEDVLSNELFARHASS